MATEKYDAYASTVYCENVDRNGWQGRAGLGWSTGVQCVDWSCYDGHRPDPIR